MQKSVRQHLRFGCAQHYQGGAYQLIFIDGGDSSLRKCIMRIHGSAVSLRRSPLAYWVAHSTSSCVFDTVSWKTAALPLTPLKVVYTDSETRHRGGLFDKCALCSEAVKNNACPSKIVSDENHLARLEPQSV